ncbi:MAG: RnfABCDGE type electron transport complex subunit B [Bacteroidales bacterium]|nr:RnfABCDGE type electron transport complex subunit B [Bacteroidales bacterium]
MTGNIVVDAVIVLGVIGVASALILYFVSAFFKVSENPLIDEITSKLPGANCGGCGFAGCRAMAEDLVKTRDLASHRCPACGSAAMNAIASLLGVVVSEPEPMMAFVRCNGSCENAPAKVNYDSLRSCAFAHSLYAGESACPYGCLGCGDCVAACSFGALRIDPVSRLPEVNAEKCVACGACAKACPRKIIEIRPKKTNGEVYVCCVNKEKGAVAKKNCAVACIGCGKCMRVCPEQAVSVTDNLAYIDYSKCISCGTCVEECPMGAIKRV